MSSLKKGKYQHYQGDIHFLVGVAKLESTLTDMAVFKCQQTGELYCCPVAEFNKELHYRGQKVKRFTKIR